MADFEISKDVNNISGISKEGVKVSTGKKGKFRITTSLKVRFAWTFIAITLTIPLIVGTTSIFYYRAQLLRQAEGRLFQTSAYLREFLAHTLFDRYAHIELLASSEIAKRGVNSSNDRDITRSLNDYIKQYEMYSLFMIFDRAGNLKQVNDIDIEGSPIESKSLLGTNQKNWQWHLLSEDKGDYIDWFGECTKSNRNSPYFTSIIRKSITFEKLDIDPYNIIFAMPIKEGGAVTGCMVSAFKISELTPMYRYAVNLTRRQIETFELSIIDQNGLVIWENFNKNSESFNTNIINLNSKIATQWKTSGQGSVEGIEIHERSKLEMLTSIVTESGFHSYPGIGWAIIARAQLETIMDPAKSQLLLFLIVTGGVLLFVIIIIFIFAQKITGPIDRSATLIEKIGDGDLTNLIHIESSDELGKLQYYVNQTIFNLRQLVEALVISRSKAAEVATEASGSSREILRSSQEQASLQEESTAALEELLASTQSIFEATQKQVSGARTNANAMEDLKHLFAKSSDIMVEITKEADETMHHAKSGGAAIQLSMVSMKEISETSQKILGIIDVINDIADQTDLLALNASIEAARAGEHGKGFSVVAQEISELAERSSSSAKEIARLLRTANQKVELGSDKVSATKEIFDRIINAMDRLSKDIVTVRDIDQQQSEAVIQTAVRASNVAGIAGDIANATKLQSQSAEEIMSDMNRAKQLNMSNVEKTESLDKLMQNLIIVLDEVSSLVHNFSLPKSAEIINEKLIKSK